MSDKPIIAVCGGVTGLQGSSVTHFLVRDAVFTARALTRNVESEKAVELARQGVQVVYADFDKPWTLAYAFEGVYGVFGVTNYFEHADTEREVRQGYALVDAAKAAGVQHFVWSTLEDAPTIPSFWTKAKIQRYLERSGLQYTNIFMSFYFETLFAIGMMKRPDGSWEITWPCATDVSFPYMAPADSGGWVTAAFLDPEEWIGKEMKVCSTFVTMNEFAQTLRDVCQLKVHVTQRTMADFLALRDDFPDPEGWDMIHWMLTESQDRDIALSRRLHGDMKDFPRWAAEYMNMPVQLPQFEIKVNFETVAETGSDRGSIHHAHTQL